MVDHQSVAAVLFLLGMLVAWLITLFDPWIGIAVGVIMTVVSVIFLLVARTPRASDRRPSSDTAFDEDEP